VRLTLALSLLLVACGGGGKPAGGKPGTGPVRERAPEGHCRPQDAWSDPDSEAPERPAWRWDGAECEEIRMGHCLGPDCATIHKTLADCQSATSQCIPVPDDCRRDDAISHGACAAYFGVRWTGTACENLSGCGCVGTDCGSVERTPEACQAAHAHCPTF
jgi:hypothetical protein